LYPAVGRAGHAALAALAPLPVSLHAGHPFADDQGVDVIGSLVRFYRFEVTHVPHNWILVHDAVGPQQIAAKAGAFQRYGRVVALQHGDVGWIGAALVLQAAHLNGQELSLGDLGDHPGELFLYKLVGGDGTVVELFAQNRVLARGLVAVHGRAEDAQPMPYRAWVRQLNGAFSPRASGKRFDSGMRQSEKERLDVTDARMDSLPWISDVL